MGWWPRCPGQRGSRCWRAPAALLLCLLQMHPQLRLRALPRAQPLSHCGCAAEPVRAAPL